jgi:putative membrane protein
MLLDTKLPISYISKRIQNDIIRVLLISIFFQALKMRFSEYLPAIPLQLPTILGSSISLLLAFNISQSYDRWWEARKIWGAIVNDSRSLAIQFSGFVEEGFLRRGEVNSPLRIFVYRQIAWCYGLGEALRSHDPLPSMQPYLSEQEAASLQHHTNKPLALLALHTEQIKDLYQQQALNSFQEVQINSTLVRLCDSMGAAERIKNTVFPSSYRLMIHFFIYLFLGTLSLGLVETIGLWEIPVLLIIASTYFLLERTARYMQDPFTNKPTDTPVSSISRTIEINLKQLLQEKDIPAPIQPQEYYLM